jgi:PAS domain S-box-containing protein
MTPASARTALRSPLRNTPYTAHWGVALMATALLYAVLGWAALGLAIPPGHASPIYPAAGLALASVLVYGWRMLPGVALGAILVNLGAALVRGTVEPSLWVFTPAVALGATLQAGVGAWLVRRYVKQPLTLSEPRDIALFFGLGAVLACFASSSIGVGTLWWLDPHPSLSRTLLSWWVWGTGDTLGVLIAAPVVLSLVAQPAADWAPRRRVVGLTLCVALLLMALGIRQINTWEDARAQATFEHDASAASTALAAQLQHPLNALEAMHGVYLASEVVTQSEFHRAAAAWIAPGSHLQAIGWGEYLPRKDLPQLVAQIRALESPAFHAFDRLDSGFQPQPDDMLMVVRHIAPQAANIGAMGVNSRSVAQARGAVDLAMQSDRPAASPAFKLTQDSDPAAQNGVVIYRAVYRTEYNASRRKQPAPDVRTAATEGVVFVTLRMADTLAAVQRTLPSYLRLCLVDSDPHTGPQRLAGPLGCEAQQGGALNYTHALPFAQRAWQLRVQAAAADVPSAQGQGALLFSVVGLLASAMLGALLLTVTGRTTRIKDAVNERTAALQFEISERQRTETHLRASEQRFRNILNNIPIGVVYTDLQGQIKQVNPRFCELTGYTEAALMMRTLAALLHPEERSTDAALIHQLVQGEVPMYRRQCRYITRDGRVVWVQAMVSLLREPSGEPSRIVGVVEDITEHMRLTEAERAREVAEAANHAKSEFLSRMSHELRTPLNAMLGFAQLLELDQNHPLPDAHKPWVAQIQNAGWHLLDMINDVLDLSRIESGTLHLLPQPLDLRELIAATLALVEGHAQRRQITITQDVDSHAELVVGDATRVKQILTNLLSNAVKYNIDGGRIHINTRRAAHDQVEITVTDTGLGMTDEQQAKLFQPFNRLGRERSTLEGTGIGLVISQRLAELMGGTLTVDSVAGQGSSFTVKLPRANALEPLAAEGDTQPQPPSSYHQRVVHYIEDNETNVEVMRGILARRPQVRLEVSITGLDGLAAIRTHHPDLILLDMHLPDISGLELLRHLKADPRTAGIPVVAVSADALAAQIEAALQAGALRYLTKPVNVVELLTVIDTVLDNTETRYS